MSKLCAGILCVLLLGLCACTQQVASQETVPAATAPQEDAADYFNMIKSWESPQNKYAPYINTIYHWEHGTAGSSGKAGVSAVALLDFSKAFAGDDAHALSPIFASMNDSQARFFASQWIHLNRLAGEALRDPARFRETFGWAGLEDFDAAPYSVQELDVLNDVISSLLCREEMVG